MEVIEENAVVPIYHTWLVRFITVLVSRRFGKCLKLGYTCLTVSVKCTIEHRLIETDISESLKYIEPYGSNQSNDVCLCQPNVQIILG